MKKSIFFFMLFSYATFLIGQSDQKELLGMEVGINATPFITNIFRGSISDPYFLMLKKSIKNGKALRFGGGLRGDFLNDDPSGPDLPNGTTMSDFSIDLRVGLEKEILTKGNWSFKTGMDVKTGYALVKNKINFGERTSKSYYGDIGPMAGFQYLINDRMGLLTEASFYVRIRESNTISEFENSTIDDKFKRTYIGFFTNLPTNIFFFVRF